jgi:outer membrane protein
MKPINAVITSIFALAIIILFYLHFSSSKPNTNNNRPVGNTAGVSKNGSGASIAYFEMDSIENQFEYYKHLAADLSQKDQSARNALAAKKNVYITKAKEYQAKAQAGGMSQDQLAAAQQEMAGLERNYQLEEQSKAAELSEETRGKMLEVKKKISDFLKEYNKDKKYTFIISNSSELMYYKDTTYNITSDIVDGLNKLYKVKK